MEITLTADLAFFALLAAIFLGAIAFITPGTGLLELGTLLMLVVSGYGILQFGVRTWALALLLGSLGPLAYALRRPRRYLALGVAVIGLAVGAAFLFPRPQAVSPLMAVGGSLMFALLMWFMAAQAQVPALAADVTPHRLIGMIGTARSPVHDEGSVQVGGQLWSARSEFPIPEGQEVRVVAVEGLVLVVEAVGFDG